MTPCGVAIMAITLGCAGPRSRGSARRVSGKGAFRLYRERKRGRRAQSPIQAEKTLSNCHKCHKLFFQSMGDAQDPVTFPSIDRPSGALHFAGDAAARQPVGHGPDRRAALDILDP